MTRREKWALVGLFCAVAGVFFTVRGCAKPPPVALEVPEKTGPLTFPPPDDGWLDRIPMRVTKARDEIKVYSPSLDKDGRFEITGQTVSISFDDEVLAQADLKRAPLVTITPAVPGRTVWESGVSVELRADKPFDPDTDYTVSLPEMTGPSGKKLTGGFKATFRATPEISIGGKIIHYFPKQGEPRVIHVRPTDDRDIGPAHTIIVIYDQPIDLGVAGGLVTMTDEKDRKIPLTLTHPPPGDTFEGEKIDTRAVVLARMAPAPPPGTTLNLSAKGLKQGVEPTTRKLHIPELPKLVSVGCGSGDACDVKGTTIRGSVHSTIDFQFSNRVNNDDIKNHVRVTPTPPKLRVSGWGENVYVDASYAPATTYQISTTGLVDRFGFPVPDASATFITNPRTASTILREGIMIMDEAGAKDFFVTTRNVKKGELLVWNVAPGGDSLLEAVKNARTNHAPGGAPAIIPFDGAPDPHIYVKTPLDLWGKLEPGHAYLAQARVKEPAHGAQIATSQPSPNGYSTSDPSVPLIMLAGKESIGAHVHIVGSQALVNVYRLGSGEAVAGAQVALGSSRSITDDKGAAVVDAPRSGSGDNAVTVRSGSEETVLPLGSATSASELYPDLAASDEWAQERELLGVIITDKGIYRPGSKLLVKGMVRKADATKIAAVPQSKVRLRVTDPMGTDILDEGMLTNAMGFVTREVSIPKGGRTGKHRIRLEVDDARKTVLADETVRVAEFETPRFKVDLEVPSEMPEGHYKARVIGRYFFGAPMDGGRVEWTVRKKAHKVDAPKLEAEGFTFGKEVSPFESNKPKAEDRPVTGGGKLSPSGILDVDATVGALLDVPTEVTFEADVSDTSFRHVSAKRSAVRHPFTRYAGIRLARRFGEIGATKVDLAVVDTTGKPAPGVPVEARLEHLEWKKSTERAESGATIESWSTVTVNEGTCSVTSDVAPKSCELYVKRSGEYRVVVKIDGRDDASTSFYAWGEGGYSDYEAVPSAGKKVPVVTDRKTYQPGETAKVLAQSPFREATAVLTIERGGLLKHEVRRVKGSSVVFDVPIVLAHAPYAHAVITLLPIGGAPDASYRVTAVRLPVSLDQARLAVRVASAKKTYDAGETAEITVEVKRGAEPMKNADVTLALVDEGVLRLTDFHAKDPTTALHPPRALDFMASDSRGLLFRRKEKAHVAGGGEGDEGESINTRKDFLETAAWLPNLVTDASGRVTAKVKLPDNLTEFRMMAVAVADDGSAGAKEDSLIVTRPFLLEPILPSFALKGDKLEIAVMAHNNTDAAATAKVKILGETRDVRLGPRSHQRVSAPMTAGETLALTFTMEVDGKMRDKVDKTLRVGLPGTEEHPKIAGVFRELQEITLAVPADAVFEDDAKLVLRTGAALYPELGQRLVYLQEYPHGCVEQTTSGTLPLLAAKNLIPWTGVVGLEDSELRKRIESGVKHLATMKTPNGGLGFWPGNSEPNVYGTAYAARALLRAKEIGIEEEGLLPDVLKFLAERMPNERDAVIRVSMAEVLAQAGKLPPESADALFDLREKLDVYGLASLALALGALPKEAERVKGLLDTIEGSFDEAGMSKGEPHGARDHHYWGSTDRDRAQTLLALKKLRPQSKLMPKLAHRLIRSLDKYTTQSTAWSLMALSSYVGSEKPNGGVDVKVRMEGAIFDSTRKLGGDNKEVQIPLKDLRGKKVQLRLEGDPKTPSAFSMEARYVRPDATSTRAARRAPLGPSVFRVFTDPKGAPVDLANVKAGDVVRVALRIELPKLDDWRATHLAVTDRLAAGFQPVQPDLQTVAQVPDIQKEHPFYEGLTGWGGSASYVDVRDDRVNVYFDRVYGGSSAYASYLMRATTPGEFVLPAARGELMYEPGSEGYSDGGRVTIR